jgi:sensor histidine kinase YesM
MPLKGKYPGKIRLEFYNKDQHFVICIRDNGVGRDFHEERMSSSAKKSMGLKLIQERLMLVYPKAQITIEDESDIFESGTVVTITIPQ